MDLLKRTVLLSRLDRMAMDLKNKKIDPKITILGKVKGRGHNDFIPEREDYKNYTLRKLEHSDFIILEQLVQVKDKELDDYVISKRFKKGEEPMNWKFKINK